MPISRWCAGTARKDRSPSRMSPEVGVSKPASIISVVVLPEPDGPSSDKNSPSWIAKSRWSTIWTMPS